MARSKNFFGLRHGSTKSLTFTTYKGQQITKDRVTNVMNPQTRAQMEQRLKMPIVSNSRAVLKTLVDHSFEGVPYGEQSLKEFSRLNLEKDALEITQYVPKGIMDTGLSNLIISKGSLVALQPIVDDYSIELLVEENNEKPSSINDLVNFLDDYVENIEYGDQLTILASVKEDNYSYYVNGEEKRNHKHKFYITRIVIDETETEINKRWKFYEDFFTDGYFNINLDMFQEQIYFTIEIDGELKEIDGACIIRSRKEGNEWKRSKNRLVINPQALKEPTFDDVLPTYLKNETNSTKYLNSGIDGVDITGGAGI